MNYKRNRISNLYIVLAIIILCLSNLFMVLENKNYCDQIQILETKNVSLEKDVDSLKTELSRYQAATMFYMRRASLYREMEQ